MIILNHNFIFNDKNNPEDDGSQYGFYRCDKCNLSVIILPAKENNPKIYYSDSNGYITKILDIKCEEYVIKKLLE